MRTGPPGRVLDVLGLRPPVMLLKDVPPGNASWLVEDRGGRRLVLRRYHAGATTHDLAYEHAVLRHLASAGWVVPEPVGYLVEYAGRWYCPTKYVPGRPAAAQTSAQQRRHGRDLARLHLALRGLGRLIGQRPGWLALHEDVTVHAGINWRVCLRQLAQASPRLAAWAQAAEARTRAALADAGAGELPVTVVHGDFARWNVHYVRGRLAGVIDFGLTHLDSRPFELAMGRMSRSHTALESYRAELARVGWPLSELEEAAIDPTAGAVRVDLLAGTSITPARPGGTTLRPSSASYRASAPSRAEARSARPIKGADRATAHAEAPSAPRCNADPSAQLRSARRSAVRIVPTAASAASTTPKNPAKPWISPSPGM